MHSWPMPPEPTCPGSGPGLGVVSEPLFLHRDRRGDSPLRTLTLASWAFSRPPPHHSAPRPHTCSQAWADRGSLPRSDRRGTSGHLRGTGVLPKGGIPQGREQEARQHPEATGAEASPLPTWSCGTPKHASWTGHMRRHRPKVMPQGAWPRRPLPLLRPVSRQAPCRPGAQRGPPCAQGHAHTGLQGAAAARLPPPPASVGTERT